ncbi:MAG: hypothetical protein AAF591_06705 [Verrucomicrobiota bacterium]
MIAFFRKIAKRHAQRRADRKDKDLLIAAGEQLLERYGRRSSYKPGQVRRVLRNKVFENRLELYLAYSVFCSQRDYGRLCEFGRIENDYEDHSELRRSVAFVAGLLSDADYSSEGDDDGVDTGVMLGGLGDGGGDGGR